MRKIFLSVIMATLLLCLTACGGESDSGKNDSIGNANLGMVNSESNNSEKEEDDSSTVDSETEEKKDLIVRISENDAKVVIDGVEFGLNTTWPEFKDLMVANNWNFEGLEKNYPDEKPFIGGGEIITSAGKISVYFMANEDNTVAVIKSINAKGRDIIGDISFCGVNQYTDPMVLSGLELRDDSVRGRTYHLDTHLYIGLWDTKDGVSTVSLFRDPYDKR